MRSKNFLSIVMSLVLAVSMTPCVAQTALAADGATDYIASPALDYDAVWGVVGDWALMYKVTGKTADGNNIIQADFVNSKGEVSMSTTAHLEYGEDGYKSVVYDSDVYFDIEEPDYSSGYVVLQSNTKGQALASLDGKLVIDYASRPIETVYNSEADVAYAICWMDRWKMGDDNHEAVEVVNLNTNATEQLTISGFRNYQIWNDKYLASPYYDEAYELGSAGLVKISKADIQETTEYTAPDGTKFTVSTPVSGADSIHFGGRVTVDSGSGPVTLAETADSLLVEVLDGYILVNDGSTKLYSYTGELVHDYGEHLCAYFVGSSNRILINVGAAMGGASLIPWRIYDRQGNLVRDLELCTDADLGESPVVGSYIYSRSFTGDWVDWKGTVYNSDGEVVYTEPDGYCLPELRSKGDYYVVSLASRSVDSSYEFRVFDSNFQPVSTPEGALSLGAYSDDDGFMGLYSWRYAFGVQSWSYVLDSNLNAKTVGNYSLAAMDNYADVASILAGTYTYTNTWVYGPMTNSTNFNNLEAYFAMDSNGKWGAVTLGGKTVLPFEWDEYSNWSWGIEGYEPNSQYILVKKDGAWYFFDAQAAGDAASGATRLAGNDRYDTMVQIVNEGFADGSCETAVLATGANFPDALAASSLAGAYKAPVILTESGSLSASAKSEIERLGVKTLYILGGQNSVSDQVKEAIEKMDITVERIAGESRQDTSVQVFNALVGQNAACDTVIVAAGKNFPDTLAVSPCAYSKNMPIVLTDNEGNLTQSAIAAIKGDGAIKNVVIVGGANSVSENVKTQLGSYTYTRLAGSDRYATSAEIAQWELNQGMTAATPAIATGKNFPDALAGAALSGVKNSILLLVDEGQTSAAEGVFSAYKGKAEYLFVYGGKNSVSAAVVETCAASAGL